MSNSITERVWGILACTHCGKGLKESAVGAVCFECGTKYSYAQSGVLNLHPQRKRAYPLIFEFGNSTPLTDESQLELLQENPNPEIDFKHGTVPRHLTREIMSYFPKARWDDSLMLDIGCGKAIHKDVCQRAGFEWVGLDYASTDATVLGDAHTLPFQNDSFEFILCVTVLQYMRYPFVMMREAFRVLQPHGRLIGTVAFLEPFNGMGFYNNTHLGLSNLLEYGGFQIEWLAPGKNWSALTALACMGLFPKMPRSLAKGMVLPLETLHRLWWKVGDLVTRRDRENMRARNFAGSFTFIASKTAV